jgi:hypothetical protein
LISGDTFTHPRLPVNFPLGLLTVKNGVGLDQGQLINFAYRPLTGCPKRKTIPSASC